MIRRSAGTRRRLANKVTKSVREVSPTNRSAHVVYSDPTNPRPPVARVGASAYGGSDIIVDAARAMSKSAVQEDCGQLNSQRFPVC